MSIYQVVEDYIGSDNAMPEFNFSVEVSLDQIPDGWQYLYNHIHGLNGVPHSFDWIGEMYSYESFLERAFNLAMSDKGRLLSIYNRASYEYNGITISFQKNETGTYTLSAYRVESGL